MSGPLLAIVSALLFGLSPVLCKLIIGSLSPLSLAGLLYLGSGLGLILWMLLRRQNPFHGLMSLRPLMRWKLIGAILAGGMIAPICLMQGLLESNAFLVSILLNLEAVSTTLLAWLLFHEHVGPRVWIGKLIVIAGAILTIIASQSVSGFSWAGFWVVAACIAWGVDNNLTRDVDDISATTLAATKGLCAGIGNLSLAFIFHHDIGTPLVQLSSMSIGALSYGASLVLFILALRSIGSARTSSYFATGPFFGMLFSLILLRDVPSLANWIAAIMMGLGAWILYGEQHEHTHTHDAVSHTHEHTHDDDHHTHTHENPTPHRHAHPHDHDVITHVHAHWPDVHHRHSH